MKTANDKIPVFSIFNDKKGLYRTIVCRCLVHRPHYSPPPPNAFRVTWSEQVFFFSQIRHGNALNEVAWEDAVQGLGMAMSTVTSEKTDRELLRGIVVYRQRVL